MSDPLIVRFTQSAEILARAKLTDRERGDIICDAASASAGDEIVCRRDDPSASVEFRVLAVSEQFVDLGVAEEWSESAEV